MSMLIMFNNQDKTYRNKKTLGKKRVKENDLIE